jgi:hypothetical protein
MFKTQNLYQNDEKWKSLRLGNSPETIGEWGGLLTSVTMMLNGIGYEETPVTVNEKIKEGGGFLRALLIPSYLSYIWPNCAYHGMERCEGASAPIAQISAAVAAGKPVILQVDSKEQKGIQTHFVLVKEKRGDDYVLYDPDRYDGDGPDGEVLLTTRYKYNGATLDSEISAVLWFDFHSAALPRPPKVARVPVPEDHFAVYAIEDGIALRARPSVDGYPWKLMVLGTELICLEPKADVQSKVGINGQWIRVQDPKEAQGYVAAWFVDSTYYPALDALPRYVLPERKKWCLNNVVVETPRFETWDTEGNPLDIPDDKLARRFRTLLRNKVVNVLKPNEIIPGDAESSSRSGIAYQETYRDYDLKKWVTTRILGWAKDSDLDDYLEDEREEFRKFVVKIENQTENSTDAQQYFYIKDASGKDAIRHNMCGELCVAYILEKGIQAVLDTWREKPGSRYNEMVGAADKPLGRPHMEDLFAVHGIEYERYQKLDDGGKPFPYNQLAFADENQRRADQRFASQAFQERLSDFYFITHLKINLDTGDLERAQAPGERNHWIVVDKVTRNGGRVELYNPFPNKREEYTFSEFYKAIGSNLNSGWWIKKDLSPTIARQKAASPVRKDGNGQVLAAEAFQAPIYRVEIDNPTPDLTDAEQFVKVEGLRKTNLCGEFCVSFVLTQSMENNLKRWMERQGDKPADMSELVAWLRAYGFVRGQTKPDQNGKTKTFSIDTVLKYWKIVQPELYNSILGGGNNETTGSEELKTILQAYGYKRGDRKTPGDFADGGLLSSPSRTAEKLKTHFFICGVTIDGNKGGRLVGNIPHWVVVDKITPIGNLVGGNGGWVELYNPFLNRWEEYSYREFMAAYNGGGLWVARDITPTFAPQAPAGAKRKEKGSPRNARSGGKKSGKPVRTQNELVQKSLQRLRAGEPPKSVARALAKQLDVSVTEAGRLLGFSTEEESPSAGVEEQIRERLHVDSVPPEIVGWIREQSRGDALLVEELTDALLEFGILSIDLKNKKGNRIDFEDPALPNRIENILQRGIDRSIPASQQTIKIVNAIGPVFAFRAIEEIKNIQARMAAEAGEVKEIGD